MTDTELAARVVMLEDRMAIMELEAVYCRLFDERDGDAWAQLFTVGGIYRSRNGVPGMQPPEGCHVEGREALTEWCKHSAFTGIHLSHPPQLHLHGDRAEARVHFEHVGDIALDGVLMRTTGYYDDTYERVDGEWRIAERVTTGFSLEGSLIDGYPV